ncbi:hypothetical protein V1504DRAFT_478025 [Lipomyces starkeyi]
MGAALWELDYVLNSALVGMDDVFFHMGTPFFYSMWQPVEYNGTAAKAIISMHWDDGETTSVFGDFSAGDILSRFPAKPSEEEKFGASALNLLSQAFQQVIFTDLKCRISMATTIYS